MSWQPIHDDDEAPTRGWRQRRRRHRRPDFGRYAWILWLPAVLFFAVLILFAPDPPPDAAIAEADEIPPEAEEARAENRSAQAAPVPTVTETVTEVVTEVVTERVTETVTETVEVVVAPPPPPAPPEVALPPAPAPAPVIRRNSGDGLYANCTEARAAGDTPLYVGDPGYALKLDRDNDGVACE